jgi:hypothetical protein
MVEKQPERAPDIRSWCLPLPPTWSEKAQVERLTGVLYTFTEKRDVRDSLIRSVRPGSIVEVLHTFLLATPYGRSDARCRDLVRVMDLIEDRGGIIRELSTGHETPKSRLVMRERANEDIIRHAKGKRSADNGRLSQGAPRTWPQSGPIFEGYRALWESRRYTNDKQRRTAIAKDFGAAPSVGWLRLRFGSPHSTKEPPPSIVPKPKFRRSLPLVYFIRNDDAVKIGISYEPRERLSSLATSNHGKLELLGTMKGGGPKEKALHRKFAKHHIKGEWFRWVPQIADYIRKNKHAGAGKFVRKRPK